MIVIPASSNEIPKSATPVELAGSRPESENEDTESIDTAAYEAGVHKGFVVQFDTWEALNHSCESFTKPLIFFYCVLYSLRKLDRMSSTYAKVLPIPI